MRKDRRAIAISALTAALVSLVSFSTFAVASIFIGVSVRTGWDCYWIAILLAPTIPIFAFVDNHLPLGGPLGPLLLVSAHFAYIYSIVRIVRSLLLRPYTTRSSTLPDRKE